MDQATRLKLSAVAFTIFWVSGMLWWSGEPHPVNIVILSVCGAGAAEQQRSGTWARVWMSSSWAAG